MAKGGTFRVVSFGEAMIRLTPPHHERLERTASLNLSPGGAELNTAVTLACLGLDSSWVSVLPETPLGRWVNRQAVAHGVDTSGVTWKPESAGRTGLYFLEEGTDPRPSFVVYDRADSAFAHVTARDINWKQQLDGAAAFHVCGITPAVSKAARDETMRAIRAANAAKVPVFFDLNYRSKLWTEAEARACFQEIGPLADVMFTSRAGLETFFGYPGDHEEVMKTAIRKLGLKAVAMTRKKGKSSRSQKMAAIAMGTNGKLVESDWVDVEVVDRLGGGDAFAGGFIAGYLEQPDDLKLAVTLGVGASAFKHTIVGDFLVASRAEVEAAALVGSAGDLQR